MTTTPDTRTVASCLRWLAELEQPDGKAVFPMLRVKCLSMYGPVEHGNHKRSCPECVGRGWIPLPEAELHLETLVDAGRTLGNIDGVIFAYLGNGLLGAARALVAAVRAREGA